MAGDLVDGFVVVVVVHDDVGWAAVVGVGGAARRAGLIGNMLHHKLWLRNFPHSLVSPSLPTFSTGTRHDIARNSKPAGTRRAIKAVASIPIHTRARAGFAERDGGTAFGAAMGWISSSSSSPANAPSTSTSTSTSTARNATSRHEAGRRSRNATVAVTPHRSQTALVIGIAVVVTVQVIVRHGRHGDGNGGGMDADPPAAAVVL